SSPTPSATPPTPTLFPYTTLFRSHIHEPARPNLELRKSLPIRPECRVVVHSGGHVPPVRRRKPFTRRGLEVEQVDGLVGRSDDRDRKSTRLNSSHDQISYAVFCLK